MNEILNNIAKNWGTYTAAAGVLFVAFVSCMPKNPPASLAEYWQWVREGLQTAIPAARPHQPPIETPPPISPNPQPPAGPAQTPNK